MKTKIIITTLIVSLLFASKIEAAGFTKLYDFDTTNGYQSRGYLLQTSNSKLYGTTNSGGASNVGVIFEYDPTTSTYTKLYDFDTTNGATPQGSLIQLSNGKLYGLTNVGGANNLGVIFEYDPTTSTYTKLYDFDITNGSKPAGSIFQASNGKLYGMTQAGGSHNVGVIFEYDPTTSTYTKLYDFDTTNGAKPNGFLIQMSNGKLYGTTQTGGTDGVGVIFEYDPTTNTYTKLYNFLFSFGYSPYGGLTLSSSGKFYGLTYSGGTASSGIIFEFDPVSNTVVRFYNFLISPNTGGRLPRGSLFQASNGRLYGLTSSGGVGNSGVLFEVNLSNNTYTKKYDFSPSGGGSSYSYLIQSTDGNLYGAYTAGVNAGALFSYTLPIVSIVTPVPTPSTNTTPSYTFSATEAGTITYGGSCSSNTTNATVGNNTIIFNELAVGTYSNCTIMATDTYSNPSNILNVPPFTIEAPDTTPPAIIEITSIPTPSTDTTPSYTFSTTEDGTITYGGSCSSSTTNATVGNNTITFNELTTGTYSNCTITVTDISLNVSSVLNISTFTIEAVPITVPVVTQSYTSSGSSVASRYTNLIGMGKLKEAEELRKEFPNQVTQISNPISSGIHVDTCHVTLTRKIRLTYPRIKGDDIKELQNCLNVNGYSLDSNLILDGFYGIKTKISIILFQKMKNLEQDGIIGPITRDNLK